MSIQKPSIPKGTRDFDPATTLKRNYILDTIKGVYKKFGFLPLETPSMENLSVLTGKYGDEGDQLIFKILNSGDYLSKVTPNDIKEGSKALSFKISEKALRYDLTVPFARYVVMNQGEINFPFKRYQIQPVWRADRPQKGRYREFYQCDADVVGTDSLLCEAEIIMMMNESLEKLEISNYTIKINNRKILAGINEVLNEQGKESDLFVAIDKLDKIGIDKVLEELIGKGFNKSSLEKLRPILEFKGNITEALSFLKSTFSNSEIGTKGITEVEEVLNYVSTLEGNTKNIELDICLARGLSYYTGAIFEVKVNNVQIGSISGGGRYDNLTGVFGLPDISGVGFSFGVDRVYDVMSELDLFPKDQNVSTQALFINFDKEAANYSLPLLTKLRANGINSELYPTNAKLKKQMNYANKKKIPFVIIIGSDEMQSGKLTLKDMTSGEQSNLTIEEIIQQLKTT